LLAVLPCENAVSGGAFARCSPQTRNSPLQKLLMVLHPNSSLS
jgi:hypothetical protein